MTSVTVSPVFAFALSPLFWYCLCSFCSSYYPVVLHSLFFPAYLLHISHISPVLVLPALLSSPPPSPSQSDPCLFLCAPTSS